MLSIQDVSKGMEETLIGGSTQENKQSWSNLKGLPT